MVYGEFIQEPTIKLCELISENLPNSLSNTYLTNSGTEAVEARVDSTGEGVGPGEGTDSTGTGDPGAGVLEIKSVELASEDIETSGADGADRVGSSETSEAGVVELLEPGEASLSCFNVSR